MAAKQQARRGFRTPRILAQATQGLPPEEPFPWLEMLMLGQIFLLVAGSTFVGRQFSFEFGIFYVLMAFFVIRDQKLAADLFKQPLREYLVKFSLGFLMTFAAFLVIFMMVLGWKPPRLPYESVGALLLMQIVFVTPSEELYFRAYLPRRIDPKKKTLRLYGTVTVGSLLSAAVFASFHYAAYGTETVLPYLIVGILAVIWTALSQLQLGAPFHQGGRKAPLGIPFTIGSHLAYNLCVVGFLTGGVVVGGL